MKKIYRVIKYPLLVLISSYLAFIVGNNLGYLGLRISFSFFVSFLVWTVLSNSNLIKKTTASFEGEKKSEEKSIRLAFEKLAIEFWWYIWIFGCLILPLLSLIDKYLFR